MRKFLLTCSADMNSFLPLFPSLTKDLFHIKTRSVLLEFLCLSLDQKSLSANGNPCIYAILIRRFRKATFLTQNVLMLVCYTKLPPCVFFTWSKHIITVCKVKELMTGNYCLKNMLAPFKTVLNLSLWIKAAILYGVLYKYFYTSKKQCLTMTKFISKLNNTKFIKIMYCPLK